MTRRAILLTLAWVCALIASGLFGQLVAMCDATFWYALGTGFFIGAALGMLLPKPNKS